MSHTVSGDKRIHEITIEWVSDGSGDFSEEIYLNGAVVRLVTNPDDTAAPTDQYDVTLLDEDGVDLLDGNGADRSGTTSEAVNVNPPVFHVGKAMFTVANAGAAKEGKARIIVAWG